MPKYQIDQWKCINQFDFGEVSIIQTDQNPTEMDMAVFLVVDPDKQNTNKIMSNLFLISLESV